MILAAAFSILMSGIAAAPVAQAATPTPLTICFGETHARCFEFANGELTDRMRGTTFHTSKLDEKRRTKLTTAVEEFKKAAIAKKAQGNAFCGDVVTIEASGKINKFCLDQMRTGTAGEKRKALLNSLGLKR